VSPSNMAEKSDTGTAFGLVGVLGAGSVGAFVVLRKFRLGS